MREKIIVITKKLFSFFIAEAFVVFLLVFSINNFIGTTDTSINADGIGYYDYLPATFIHGDIHRKDWVISNADSLEYTRVNSVGCYNNYENNSKVNKYSVGTAILQAPFFFYTLASISQDRSKLNGYEKEFQRTIFHSALFYLFLTLIFFREILILHKVNKWLIFSLQILLVLGTTLSHYVHIDAAYSHVYSLFVFSILIYLSQLYFLEYSVKSFYLICIALGFITIIRPVNVIVFLFIPFMANDYDNLKQGVIRIFKSPKTPFIGLVLFLSIVLIQSYFWYIQTGDWFVYSYREEGFNFGKPELFNVLFSYEKGLFIYTPVLLFSLLGLIQFLINKQYYKLITWILPMFFVFYITSSWWCWNYGASFGMRPLIEYYIFFFIVFGLSLKKTPPLIVALVLSIAALTIPINLIQSYQYKVFILHWGSMDEDSYWNVFLQTGDNYRGWLWKKKYNYNHFYSLKTCNLEDIDRLVLNSFIIWEQSSDEIQDFSNLQIVQFSFENDFRDLDYSNLIFEIKDDLTGEVFYWHKTYTTIAATKARNSYHRGVIDWEFEPIKTNKNLTLRLMLYSENITFHYQLNKPKIDLLRLK